MGRGRLAGWVAGAAVIAVASFACRQLVGIGDGPPQGPGGTTADAGAEGGFTYGQGDCAACVATNCATQATACAGTPSCAALEGCMSAANGDATMRAQCGVTWGLGNDGATPAFEACLATSCETQCGLVCGGLAAVFPPATAPACETCIAGGSVCPSVRDCAKSVQCQTALRCQFSSDTPDVEQACLTLPDAGAIPLTAAASEKPPLASSCATECSWGADWSCLGHVDWPAATTKVALTVDVFDLQNGTPIDDATVKVCGFFDTLCTIPIPMENTGDSGTVTMNVDFGAAPQAIYVDVTSPTTDPVLEFPSAPLSQARVTFPGATLPAMSLAGLAQLAQVSLDPTLGVLAVSVHDCRLAPAAGVTMVIDPPGSTLVYNQGGRPFPMATATDTQGAGVFYNVPPAPTYLAITLTLPVSGHPQNAIGVFARPNEESILYALPTK